MGRIIFKIDTLNNIEVLDSDFAEELITVKTEGESKIITLSSVEEDLEIVDEEEYI